MSSDADTHLHLERDASRKVKCLKHRDHTQTIYLISPGRCWPCAENKAPSALSNTPGYRKILSQGGISWGSPCGCSPEHPRVNFRFCTYCRCPSHEDRSQPSSGNRGIRHSDSSRDK